MAAVRTAIIAIHGVGEHINGQTAKAVAQQLQRNAPTIYPGPELTSISIPVTGSNLPIEPDKSVESRKAWRLRLGMGSPFRARAENAGPDVDVEFSESLLKGGTTYNEIYETVRYSMAPGDTRVEVFELYWSDLSHVGKNATALIGEIFQLVIHLASLGRTAAITAFPAAEACGIKNSWNRFYGLNAFSYWLLATPIVLGNLVLVLLGLLTVPALLLLPKSGLDILTNASVQAFACPGIVALLVAALSMRLCIGNHNYTSFSKQFMVVLPFALGAAAGAIFYGLQGWLSNAQVGFPYILTGLVFCLLAVAGDTAMKAYDRIRPGVLFLWRIVGVVLVFWMAGVAYKLPLFTTDPVPSLLSWIGHSAEGPFVVLVLVWSGLYITNLAMFGFGCVIPWIFSKAATAGNRAVLKRSIHTSFIAASLPAPVFLAVVLTLWAAVYNIFKTLLPNYPFQPWATWFLGSETVPIDKFVVKLIDLSANSLFFIYVLAMLLAGLVAFWGLAPSIFRELFPGDLSEARPSAGPMQRLSLWLDGGYSLLGVAAVLAGAGFFIIFPWGSLEAFWHVSVIGDDLGTQPPLWNSFVALARIFAGGAAVGLIAASKGLLQLFGDSLSIKPSPWSSFATFVGIFVGSVTVGFIAASKLLLKSFTETINRFRVLIDVALDVDNWLRERPRGKTPRLRIFARFAALLNFIAENKYDRVIIVAHSQGTVVATDFLRYMKAKKCLSRYPPIDLLTLGSPLRQLYAWRFPALYQWVNRPVTQGQPDAGPVPKDCGLGKWINIYGSGDYVGRELWNGEGSIDGTGLETCIGAEAHTHYLDQNCKVVATRMAALI